MPTRPMREAKWTWCIYRVKERLRVLNPEAYAPQILSIGPLNRNYFKPRRDVIKGIWNEKKDCLKLFTDIYGYKPVGGFEEIIKKNMRLIRECYDLLSWDSDEDFVKLIIHDSVFILLFFMKFGSIGNFYKKEEIVSGLPSVLQIKATTIKEDLILLENQLPYALLEELFEPFISHILHATETFRDITLRTFGLEGKINKEVRFLHFTDLFWRVRVSTLPLTEENENRRADETESQKNMYNAEELYNAGVSFVTVDKGNPLSLVITFEDGILKLPLLIVDGNTVRHLGNLMALEQSHYPETTYVCDYVSFDFHFRFPSMVRFQIGFVTHFTLKGIVRNLLGDHGLVTEMVKKLCTGLKESRSQYYDDVAERLNKYYDNCLKRSFNSMVTPLQRDYFKDIWTGLATVAAVVLLLLTLIQTVTSILQVTQNDNKSLPPPAPCRGP